MSDTPSHKTARETIPTDWLRELWESRHQLECTSLQAGRLQRRRCRSVWDWLKTAEVLVLWDRLGLYDFLSGGHYRRRQSSARLGPIPIQRARRLALPE